MLDMGAGLPAEILATADLKVEQFVQLKTEVERQVNIINERVGKIGALIRNHSNSTHAPDSLLR